MSIIDQARSAVLEALQQEPGLRIGETFGTWACPEEWPSSVLYVGILSDQGGSYRVKLTRYDHPENDLARYSTTVVHDVAELTATDDLVMSALAGVRAARRS